jgi:hypothetical protein
LEKNKETSKKSNDAYYCLSCNIPKKIFHDTRCTPTSYFSDKPRNFKEVKTASNESVKVYGRGEISIGEISLLRMLDMYLAFLIIYSLESN